MPEHRTDTAATPAPDDTLRERIQTLLARTADEIDMEFDHQEHPEGTCPICDALFVAGHQVRDLVDALLPLIRDHVAAAVQAERERPPTHRAESANERVRAEFLRLLTEDGPTNDRRRRDYNQAIFLSSGEAVWSSTTLDMVMNTFDCAMRNVRRTP